MDLKCALFWTVGHRKACWLYTTPTSRHPDVPPLVPYFYSQSKPRAHAVRVAWTVVLEAGQEYFVRGHTQFREPVKGEMMLSPTEGFVKKHRLLVARVLVEAQPFKTVPIRILNSGNAAVTAKRETIGGLLHPAKALQPAACSPESARALCPEIY